MTCRCFPPAEPNPFWKTVVSYAYHGGRPTGLRVDENTPSGQTKGQHTVLSKRPTPLTQALFFLLA